MSPKIHVPCGIISGGIVFAFTQSLVCAASCCLANFVFDFDHVLEYGYYCIKYKKKPSLKVFFSGKYFEEKNTIAVIFHGYEYVFLFLLLSGYSYFYRQWAFLMVVGIIIGYSEHMILDLIGNDCSIKGYSLIYRILVKFKIDLICDREKSKK